MNPDFKKIQEDLKRIGINRGDDILIHASFKSLGKVEGGIQTLIEALLATLGDTGTLLMPALSYQTVTAENPSFDIRNTPVCVGAVPEFFRTFPGVERSMHPTHSVCVRGRRQKEYLADSEKDDEPVGENSPFCKLPAFGGKVLMIGCGTHPNTSMHGVEEKAGVPYVLSQDKRKYTLVDETGKQSEKAYFYHYISQNGFAQRYCRLENLMEFKKGSILQAECCLIDSVTMWKTGLQKLQEDPFYFVEKL